jgi:streptomycin 6-kinase
MSVVVRCHLRDGQAAVLKVSPDRARVAHEAAALDKWTTDHSPSVLAHDDGVGALLLEGIEPGTPLVESRTYPAVDDVSELLTSLHRDAVPDPTYPAVARHVAYLFDATEKLYTRHPQFAEVVSPELYERGRRLATALAADPAQTVLLHGDLTPSNILDGGPERGLVAIDPAPCLGDPAFDVVDLVLWQADSVDTVVARADALAPAIGADETRLLDWCAAFATMTALELVQSGDTSSDSLEAVMTLANSPAGRRRAPRH